MCSGNCILQWMLSAIERTRRLNMSRLRWIEQIRWIIAITWMRTAWRTTYAHLSRSHSFEIINVVAVDGSFLVPYAQHALNATHTMHDHTDAIACIDASNQGNGELNLRRDCTSWLLSCRCTIATAQKRYNLFIKLFALIYVTRLNGHLFHNNSFSSLLLRSLLRLIFLHLLFFCNFFCTPDRNQLVNYYCGTKCAVFGITTEAFTPIRCSQYNMQRSGSCMHIPIAQHTRLASNVNVELIYLQFYIII